MAYLALYREWRPKTFREMVGQQHVVRTLTNALKQERVAHAYLFSGPRGTGKTTAAKILAKALNCVDRDGVEPCNRCPSCVSIDQGSAMEVLEIDAASNRGIDEIRDLREKVKLSAGQGRYKVYIIDEVHMLTAEAFNALLKTLEEPPAQVVFVLATTEVHKIPLTILSRVQRFEFHRLATAEIAGRLAEVCQAAGREAERAALQVIAQKAEGGLRDALSILDQCLLAEDVLTVAMVYQVLGMMGESFSAGLVEAFLASDYGRALQLLEEAVDQGRDPRQAIRELIEYLRQLLLAQAAARPPQLPEHLRERAAAQAAAAGVETLLDWLHVLLEGESQLRFAANARLAAEMLLVQTLYASQTKVRGDRERASASAAQVSQAPAGQAKSAPSGAADGPAAGLRRGRDAQRVAVPLAEAGGSAKTVRQDKPTLTLEMVQARWDEVLERVRRSKKSTHAFLLEGHPLALADNVLTLVFRDGFSFHRDKIDQPENRRTVEQVLEEIFKADLTVASLMESEFSRQAAPPGGPADEAAGVPMAGSGLSEEELLIKRAQELFGPERVVVHREG